MKPLDGMNDMGAADPDAGAEATEQPAAGGMEICVPLSSLGVPGDGEQMENPAEGDRVDFTVEGKVSRIEGGNAYVTPEAVNGTPVENTDAGAQPADDGLAGLEQAAREHGPLG